MYNEFRKIGQEYYCFILTQLKNTGITLLKIMLFTNNLSLKELWRERQALNRIIVVLQYYSCF